MTPRPPHPYCIDIKPNRYVGGFTWTIRRRGAPCVHSDVVHATFEEARAAGKAVLEGLVSEWLGSAR